MFGVEWTVSFPVPFGLVAWLWARVMKPRVEFGSPVQRGKHADLGKSWWHIPVNVSQRLFGAGKLEDCVVFLQDSPGQTPGVRLDLRWGDMSVAGEPSERQTLHAGQVYLVPIIMRDEIGEDYNAYITESFFFAGSKVWPIPGDSKKRRLKIGISTGRFTATSKHFYLVRVPAVESNGQFTLEMQFGGGGTLPVPLEHSEAPAEHG